MNRFSFYFWFFYASRAAIGVLLHMGTHQFVYFDSTLTLAFAGWLLFIRLQCGAKSSAVSSAQPVLVWTLLYLGWSFVTLLWTPAPLLLSGGKLLKIILETGIVLVLIDSANVHEITAATIRGFVSGAILAAALYPFYPFDEQGRVGVEGGLGGYEIPIVVGLAGVIALIQWLSEPNRWRSAKALILAAATMVLMFKACIIAYAGAIAPFLYKSGSRKLARALIAIALIAWVVFPWVAPYLIPYVDEGGYLTLTGRVYIWADALEFIQTKPIFGSGYDSAKVLLSDIGDFSPGHAHNEWLQNWMCLGAVGVLLLMMLFLSFFRVAWINRSLPVGQIALALLLFGFIKGMSEVSPDLCPPIGLMLLLTAEMNPSALAAEPNSNHLASATI